MRSQIRRAWVWATPRVGENTVAFSWIVAFVVPAAFQLLYGVYDVGLIEEWGVQQRFDQIGPVFWTPLAGAGLAAQSIRPLTVAPHSIAYFLDPDSFVWYHLLNAMALGLKGLAMMALLIRLGIRRSICVSGAVVFALFPAWNGLFTFRMIHGQFALAALVFALTQLLAFHERPSWRRAVTIAVGLSISLLVYEVSYIAVGLAPALLAVRGPIQVKRLALTCAVWFSIPFLNGIRIVTLLGSDRQLYQRDLVTKSSRHPLREFGDLVQRVFRQGLSGFVDRPSGIKITLWAALLLLVSAAAVLCATSREWRGPKPEEERASDGSGLDAGPRRDVSDRCLLILIVGSFASAPVVTLIYAPQPAHLVDPLRIFSIASLPLAVGIACLVEGLARRSRAVGLAAAILLLGTTASSAAAQREMWHGRSTFQEDVLGAIAAATASVPDTSNVIVIDSARLIGDDVYELIPEILRQAVGYLKPGVQNVLLCRESIDQMPDAAPLPTDCALQNGVVTNNLGSVSLDAATVIEIRSASPGLGWSGAPQHLDEPRVRSVLHCVEKGTCDAGALGVQARVVQQKESP